jgi:hypothetical protein
VYEVDEAHARRNRAVMQLTSLAETLKVANYRETFDVLNKEDVMNRLYAAYVLYFDADEVSEGVT